MARDNDELMHADPAGEGENKGRSPVKIAVVAIVIGLLVWKTFAAITGDDDQSQSANSGQVQQRDSDRTTTFDRERAEQRRTEDQIAQSGVDEAFNIDDRTNESSVVAVDRRVNAANERIEQLRRSLDENTRNSQRDMAQLQNSVEEKLSQLTNAIERQGEDRILEERDALLGGQKPEGGTVSTSGLPALDDQPSSTTTKGQAKPDNAFPYMELGARSQPAESSGGLFSSPSSSRSGTATNRPVSTSTPPPPPSEAGGAMSPLTGDVVEVKPEYDSITVPGNSWVHVTDLHGVACPVANASGQRGGDGPRALLSEVPITLPVKGEFHGPNGTTYHMGSPHVSGTCVGQESNRPAAIVKIERLSYVGPDGKPQFIPINGYLIDRRDNQMGVAGYLDQASGREIALASFAAGMSAAGEVFSDSQFNTQIFGGGAAGGVGSARSIDGGNIPAAVAGDAFGEAFGRIAEFYDRQAARIIPVVRIQAGLPMTMITTTPFEYLAKNSNAEVSNVQ
ncbi:hypothetical protein J7355_16745 [Endozoicomonas sp. G2_2]|uniref:hypothetical protein n=1 Tax=Endozoicomonas sp. G2_2 TaxID=2821092 RepID=UPI001ADA4B59|nr:hypothetical protein [Endozoicomonas sp. G2_2]MBO9471741.1 hypothetical protein [Endozoicomonas sp. G2_2]